MSKDAYTHTTLPGAPGGPLLFLFHGTGGNENQMLGLALDLMPGVAAVSPRGDVSENGAARFFRRAAEGVYDMDDLARATGKMARFVKAHIEAAMPVSGPVSGPVPGPVPGPDSGPVSRPFPVVGIGFSNGANILASLLFAEPDLFDAVVLMHPLIPFEPEVKGSLTGKRVLVTAGRRDPICPPQLTERLVAYLRDLGAAVTVEWHEGGHEVRPNEIEAARRFLSALPVKGA